MTTRRVSTSLLLLVLSLGACGRATAPEGSTAEGDSYDGWQVYTSAQEGVTFMYPPDWSLSEEPIDIGEGERKGHRISVRSSGGFTVTWSAPLMGIGGWCDNQTAPHVFLEKVEPMPDTGSKNQLSLVVASWQKHKTLAVVDTTSLNGRPLVTGDTGACLYYPTFAGLNGSSILQFATGTGVVQLGNSSPGGDTDGLSVEEFLARPDVAEARLVLRSLRYRAA